MGREKRIRHIYNKSYWNIQMISPISAAWSQVRPPVD